MERLQSFLQSYADSVTINVACDPLYRRRLEMEMGYHYTEIDLLLYAFKHMLIGESITAIFNILHVDQVDSTLGDTNFVYVGIFKNECGRIIVDNIPRAPSLVHELRVFLNAFEQALPCI
jgi:hypothetical protein